MIRVTIDLIPVGLEACKLTMSTLEIWNDGTGTRDIGNYDYKLIPREGDEIFGRVEGFPRNAHGDQGSLALVKTVLAEIMKCFAPKL